MSKHAFPYLSSSTFLLAPTRQQAPDRPLCVAGIAWDGSVTNRPGARFGPAAIRHASQMLCDAEHPVFNRSPHEQVCDAGDLLLPNTSLEAMRAALQPQAEALIAAHRMAWIGGDHSITLPLLRAYRKLLGRPLALLHFDAHCDTWTDHFGEPSGHGTWTYEALQEGLVLPQATIQVGIRSAGVREAREYVNTLGGRVFTARELRGAESPQQLAFVIDEIRRRVAAAGNPPVYLSLDIDCLDPAFAPGTGTPEPGGMTSAQVLTILEETADLPWIGMDCVEVSPPYDVSDLTTNAAATFLWTWLSGQAR
ncbi:agmatinase [Niveibacterium sp. 24ML]|uniref:agmatinase n=1 Tax=Niveibacterium sp. 24ML TaxID=2985512 RepID=UPI00226E2726|nr:agmatinase [Niveibacterium sp. 24ML]MCX9156406.1 agmatinase [Niveibacterium sp. 24ML]